MNLPVISDVVILKPCRGGKHNVRHLGRGCLEYITRYRELYFFKSLVRSLCIFPCKQEIASKDDKRPNFVGLSFEYSIPYSVRCESTDRGASLYFCPPNIFAL